MLDPKRAVEIERERDARIGGVVGASGRDVRYEELLREGYRAVDLRREKPSEEALGLLPEQLARRYRVLPLSERGGYLEVACCEPSQQLANLLSLRTRRPVRFRVAPAEEVDRAVETYYSRVVSVPRNEGGVADDTWAARMVDACLQGALKARASDVHFDPQEGEVLIRYRIDGVLHDAGSIPLEGYPAVVSRVKVLAGMSVVEHLLPQDGQLVFDGPGGRVDVRASVVPSVRGEKVVLRVLDRGRVAFDLGSLGFEPDALAVYREMVGKAHGMVLVVGPTGSGKTTTLYSSIKELDLEAFNVMTLEDPVEYQFARVTQVQVNAKAGLTFAVGLRAFLRQDPDVIVVGEVRDAETAKIAVQAALTGHLVLSSLHAMDSVSGLLRLVDMGVEPYFVAAAVTGVVAQRLLRKVCSECREEYPPSEAEVAFFRECGLEPPARLFRGSGCALCAGTGYLGRTGVYEVLPVREGLRALVSRGGSRTEVQEAAFAAGMEPLVRAALRKAVRGETSVAEVVRVAHG